MIGADLDTPWPETFVGESRARLDKLNQTLRGVPACGLRFGAGLNWKGSEVTLVASSVDLEAAAPPAAVEAAAEAAPAAGPGASLHS